ncbi:unnamed protein product, partial [Strongylus vulgaris]
CDVDQWTRPIAVSACRAIKQNATNLHLSDGAAKVSSQTPVMQKAHVDLCIDLNECERGDHTCDHYAVCHNTDGSFTCECRPGYTGDGHHCTTLIGDESEMDVDTTMDAVALTEPLRETEPQQRLKPIDSEPRPQLPKVSF